MTQQLRAPAAGRELPAGNLSTGTLKLIALVFMFIDHFGKVFCGNMLEMRLLGRIAFPIYAWCMVVGFTRTRNVPKYILRVFLLGVLSQPLADLALHLNRDLGAVIASYCEPLASGFSVYGLFHTLYRIFLWGPNVLWTLAIGLAALWGIREKKWYSHIWAPAAALLLVELLKADYGWEGIMFMMLLYAARNSRPAIAAVYIPFWLFMGATSSAVSSLFGWKIQVSSLPAFIQPPVSALMRLRSFALLALPLILIPFPRDIRLPKWLSYAIYPGHLVILILLKLLFPA